MTGADSTQHQVRVERIGRKLWVGLCSCGAYRSRSQSYPGYAERYALEHARSKERSS